MRQLTVEFMEEVYPDASELALSMFDEQTVLRDATTVIREYREEITRLREALEQQRGWWAKGYREGMNDSDAVYILQIKQRDEEIARLRELLMDAVPCSSLTGDARKVWIDSVNEACDAYRAALADTESQNGGTSPRVPTVRDREEGS